MRPRLRHPGPCLRCTFRLQKWGSFLPFPTPQVASFATIYPRSRQWKSRESRPRRVRSRIAARLVDDREYKNESRKSRNFISLKGRSTSNLRQAKSDEELKDLYHTRLLAIKRELEESFEMRHTKSITEKEQDQKGNHGKGKNFGFYWVMFKSLVLDDKLRPSSPLDSELRASYVQRGQVGLDGRLKYAFYDMLFGRNFTKGDLIKQQELADLRYPAEWYPSTRSKRRAIHLHVGPTNSGKTYHALKKLEGAETGIYAGPLRLLAHEVYTRMNAAGKKCALVTGDERKYPSTDIDYSITSCTVEMVPVGKEVDVAVIDEIQMIGDEYRGWAWTQAFLGIIASEVHLCGEERTVPLIREICASIGDELHIHRYERLSPLKMMDDSLKGGLKKLEKGDCVISFSIMGIHALRREIEKSTGKKCAMIYGSLPPETRAQQARLFNDPNNDYDFLVASDAVGMGLNLSIKRIIFESSQKNNGSDFATLQISEIKQIAGRAGRYRTAPQLPQAVSPSTENEGLVGGDSETAVSSTNSTKPADKTIGYVTTLESLDYPIISRAMQSEAPPIQTAGIFPPNTLVERFSNYFPPGTPLSYILLRLTQTSQTSHRLHLCRINDAVLVADIIEPVRGLTTAERLVFVAAPAPLKEKEGKLFIQAMATAVAEQKGGGILELPHLNLDILAETPNSDRGYLIKLEGLHKQLVAYLWLSYHFTGIFLSRALAAHIKSLIEDRIEATLTQFSQQHRSKMLAMREKSMLKKLKKELMGQEQAESENVPDFSTQQPTGDGLAVGNSADQEGGKADEHIVPPEIVEALVIHDSIADESKNTPAKDGDGEQISSRAVVV